MTFSGRLFHKLRILQYKKLSWCWQRARRV